MSNSRQYLVIGLVVAVHVLVDLVLLAASQIDLMTVSSGAFCYLVLMWPMSQASLVAIWAAISRMPLYVRFVVAVLGLWWTCYMASVIFYAEAGIRDEVWVALWVTITLTQAAGIVIVIVVCRVVWTCFERRQAGSAQAPFGRQQFSIASLLIWTAALAAVLGLGKTAAIYYGWRAEEFAWHGELLWLGAFHAVCALLVLASLTSRAPLWVAVPLGVITLGLLTCSEAFIFFEYSGGEYTSALTEAAMLNGFQAMYLYATLLPLRLCGRFGVGGKRLADHSATPIAWAEIDDPGNTVQLAN